MDLQAELLMVSLFVQTKENWEENTKRKRTEINMTLYCIKHEFPSKMFTHRYTSSFDKRRKGYEGLRLSSSAKESLPRFDLTHNMSMKAKSSSRYT